jgi:hypothetical protein
MAKVNIPDLVRTAGWRQGDIIDDKVAIRALISSEPDFLVIITQDCDIVQSLDNEPYIEFLAGKFTSESDGNLYFGKNPRRLQVAIDGKMAEFVIHDHFRVKKEIFAETDPRKSTAQLSKNDVKLIARWISKRYIRPAFPDEFNARLSKSRKQSDTLSKNMLLKHVSLIFIDVDDEELPAGQDYEIQITVGVAHDIGIDSAKKIDGLFNDAFTVPGISIKRIRILDEFDITYGIINTYKRFDWDFRSLPENSNVASPAHGIDTI